jgi:hypothetical protein
MVADVLTMKIGAAAAGVTPASPARPAEGARFAQALARAVSTPVAGVSGMPAEPVREVPGASAKSGSGTGLGDRILHGIESIYRSDQGLKRPGATSAIPAPASAVRTAALAPGPAAAPLASRTSTDGRLGPPAGMREPGDFDSMLRSLEQVYTHAIQVSVVTKTTGSFTSSMNKLMSSA